MRKHHRAFSEETHLCFDQSSQKRTPMGKMKSIRRPKRGWGSLGPDPGLMWTPVAWIWGCGFLQSGLNPQDQGRPYSTGVNIDPGLPVSRQKKKAFESGAAEKRGRGNVERQAPPPEVAVSSFRRQVLASTPVPQSIKKAKPSSRGHQ